GVIGAGIRAVAFGHDAEDGFAHGRRVFVHRPNDAINVVAENRFAAEVAREFFAAVNVTADDRAAVAVRIIENRRLVFADERRHQMTLVAFDFIPLKIQGALVRFNHVNFFTRTFADIADENSSTWRVNGHAMRTAQAETKKFFERIGLADKRIVVRNKIICRKSVLWLTRNWMADISAATIHVNPQNAGVKTLVDDLVVVTDRIVANGQIKKSILRMKKHSAAIVPDGLVGLVNENSFGIRNRNSIFIEREARKPVVVSVWQNWIWPSIRVADDSAGINS